MMNRDLQNDWELTAEEFSLERELRGLAPWHPSPGLRHRLDAEASRSGVEPSEPAGETQRSLRFLPVRFSHAVAALAAAVALLGVILVPLWMPGNPDRLAGEQTVEDPVADELGVGPGELILTDRVLEDLPEWQKDQFLLGRESVGMVRSEKGPAMWQVRYRLLNHTSWKDQETGAMREQFVPEERVLFVPVRYH